MSSEQPHEASIFNTARKIKSDSERAANEQAQKRLAQIEKGNEIITSIFTDLDMRQVKAGTEPLEAVLAKRLVKAAELDRRKAVEKEAGK